MKILDRKVSINIDGNLPECISSPEEMLLFDIETTGLKKENCRVYLIGCAYLEKDGWHIRQFLTQSSEDEPVALSSFALFAGGFKTLITFNGEGFDIPFIDFKNKYYGIDFDIKSMESLDIYKTIKPAKKLLGAQSLSQKSVEKFLNIKREDKLDGGLLIPYYYEYERTLSAENERLLLLHNFEDVLGMGQILPVLAYTHILNGGFEFSTYVFDSNKLTVNYVLKGPVPKDFKNDKISACENILSVDFDIKDGRVLLPLSDPENYYYLPFEDTVIHKELASFVGKNYRRKATKENCFLKVKTENIKSLTRDDFKLYAINMINIYK